MIYYANWLAIIVGAMYFVQQKKQKKLKQNVNNDIHPFVSDLHLDHLSE